jgi:glycosyltransferase involved in cell wall biosynthesis
VKKRKICHVTSAHNRYDIRIFIKECISLVKNGFDVTLLVNDNYPNEIKEGVRIISTNIKGTNRFQRFFNSYKKLYSKALEIDADVYHLHDPDLLIISNKLTANGKKVIYDSHEDVPRQILSKAWIPEKIRPMVAYLFEKYENKTIKKLDAVVVPTPHIEERFSKLNRKVYQICNFPLLSEFNLEKNSNKRKDYVCYVGGISVNRGIKEIVEATKNINVDLVLCGNFSSKDLEEEILSNKHVKHLGFLDREGIVNILKEAKLGFVTLLPTPNHVNSYPIKMFEYMAAEMPIISSNFPLWKSIIEQHHCGLCINPNNINEIQEAINYILNTPKESSKMGIRGKKAVLEYYNWGTQEKKLVSLYQNL